MSPQVVRRPSACLAAHSRHQSPLTFAAAVLAYVSLFAIPANANETEPIDSTGGATISFERQIAPIFRSHCNGCHQPAAAKGDYVMTTFDSLLAAGESGEPAIVPGDSSASYLLDQIRADESGHAEMPKDAEALTEAEVDLIAKWIDQGAENDGGDGGPEYSLANAPTYARLPLVTSLAFSPDASKLAVAGSHEVFLLSGDGRTLLHRLIGLSERIEAVAFSPDGTKLAVAGGRPGREGELQVWDAESGALLRSISVGADTVYGASWSPDGTHVAVGCPDNVVRAFDIRTGEQTLFMGSHNDWPLDTVWSHDGSQLVSVGRDMTAKLTEVATERFIDNITSITPGALKGGLYSVALHPFRDEILIGGADGEPKIYRLERKTKRVIGDNAQLMRILPPLDGRVFGVAFSSTGQRAAAVSSLNGRGSLAVYETRHSGELPEAIKTISEKRGSSRSEAENEQIEAYRRSDVKRTWMTELPSGQFTVAFAPGGQIVVAAGGDGLLRFYLAEDGTPLRTVAPIELQSTAAESLLEAMNEPRPDHTSIPREEWAGGKIERLTVEPERIDLTDRFATVQLLVTAHMADGTRADVTRLAEVEAASAIEALPGGLVRPLAEGEGTLVASFEGQRVVVPVLVSGLESVEVSYSLHVNPVMSKLGCNQGTCHGAKDGKEGFKLSLRGYDPLYDLRALTDDLKSRRVNVAQPDDSLMLLKAGGRVPHVGGAICEPGTDAYATLRGWIAGGAGLDETPTKVASIEVQPSTPVLGVPGSYQQMRVVARLDNGQTRDVTAEAFLSSGNLDVASCDSTGLIKTLRRGEAPVLARYEGKYAATTITVMGDRDGFEWEQPPTWGPIDTFAAKKWERMKIRPSGLCDDATFIRRVSLDLTGLPPSAADVRTFIADNRDTRVKRSELIDRLLASEAYTDFWTNKWADLLMVNRKFLGAEGAKLYREWIRERVARNMPYDEFVREIVTASGSNRENPAASYWKVLRDPAETMENTTHLFLATRFNCNKCHDHPFERWTQDQYYETAAFFAQVDRRSDAKNSKGKTIGGSAVEKGTPLFEVVADADDGEITHDRTGQITLPAFPYEAEFDESVLENREDGSELSRREELALWITSPDNRYFASSYVNRIWGYLLGVGLIEPLDDIRAGNPPSNPDLLAYLEQRFIDSGFDVRAMQREICNSRTYQLDVATNRWNEDDGTNYSHAYPKRLPAEVLYDTIHFALGSQSNIPGMPAGTRALQLPDAGVKLDDGFLANLGRPVRESSCECERSSDMQLGSVMALVSGPTIESAISDPSNGLAKLVAEEPDNAELVRALFLRVLNRPATEEEVAASLELFGRLEADDAAIERRLAEYRDAIRMQEISRELQHDLAITELEAEIAAYEQEIAPREARLDREQAEKIAGLEKQHANLVAALPAKVDAFVAATDASGPRWQVLEFSGLSERVSKQDGRLNQLPDRTVVATESTGLRGLYQLDAKLQPGEAITGLKIEAVAHGSLPRNGPGRSGNGNFVVTEVTVKGPPVDGGQYKNQKIAKAAATFEQDGYTAAGAIDGVFQESGNGWAINPKTGRDQSLMLKFATPYERGEDGRNLQIQIDQRYQNRTHVLGRFRVWYTTDSNPLQAGLPLQVAEAVKAEQRTEEQTAAIATYLSKVDEATRSKELQLQAARLPRPDDAKLAALRTQLVQAKKPLLPNPQLVRLERAEKLSGEQLDRQRLTAVQDLAWALMNGPAFLFNH